MRKENFDESVKRILEQNEFAYDPAAWEQAQALLATTNRRRLGGWWWTALLLALSTLVGAGISGIQELRSVPLMAEQQQTTAAPQAAAPSKNKTAAGVSISTSSLDKIEAKDSSRSTPRKPVRLVHLAVDNAEAIALPPHTETDNPNEPQPGLIAKRNNKVIPSNKTALLFSAQQRELPAFDFNYASRPLKNPRESGLAAFAWVGQQGRNAETNNLQQQYGLGLNWQVDLAPRLGLHLGAALGYNTGLSYSSQRSDTSYGFGRTITSQIASVNSYWQLQLPVSLSYRLAPKHRLDLGAAFHEYLGSRYRLQTAVLGDDIQSSNSEQLSGKISDITLPRWSWHAGYRYTINNAFELGIRYQKHTRPGNAFPAENSLRIVLHYHFYRFSL